MPTGTFTAAGLSCRALKAITTGTFCIPLKASHLNLAEGRVISFLAYYITKYEKSENEFIMTLAFKVQLEIENVSHNRKIVIK